MEMYENYGDDVQFLLVYIREAHAMDSRSPMGGGEMPLVEDPKTIGERNQVAQICMTKLALEGLPAVVDNIDDLVNKAYGAGPDRLYLIGTDGNVAYKGRRGPSGFLPDELEAAIVTELGH